MRVGVRRDTALGGKEAGKERRSLVEGNLKVEEEVEVELEEVDDSEGRNWADGRIRTDGEAGSAWLCMALHGSALVQLWWHGLQAKTSELARVGQRGLSRLDADWMPPSAPFNLKLAALML